MKTLMILLFCGSMLSANQLFAQKEHGNLLPVVTITAGSNVSEVVQNAFFSKFKNAENLRWFIVNQNYLVKFIMDDQEQQAAFRKDGEFMYRISYGTEVNLPSDIKMQVKSRYSKHKINQVFNVDRNDRNLWIVNLESPKNYVITSIENKTLNEITRFKNVSAGNRPVASNK